MRDALLIGFIALCLLAALRWPFVGILTWAWFSLMNPHQLAYGAAGLPLNAIIAGVTIASIAVNGAWRAFSFDRITALLFALSFWMWMSQLFSLDPENSAPYFERFIKQLLFVLLCVQLTTDRLRLHALLWMLVIGVGYFALKGGLFTLATLGQFRVQGPPNTILEDNNHMGVAIATILPLILYLRAQAANVLVRHGLLALFAASVLAVLGTQSRGAFAALLVFAAYLLLRSQRKLTILAGLALVLVPAVLFMPAQWSERMSTMAEAAEDASFMGRVDSWVVNAKLASEHPLTGAGLRNSYVEEIAATVDPERAERAKAAHSIYFEMLGGAGVVGFLVYLALLLATLLAALALQRRLRKRPDDQLRAFGYSAHIALVVFLVGGASVSLEMWDGYLMLIALVGAAAKLARDARLAAPQGAGWRFAIRGIPRGSGFGNRDSGLGR